MLGSAGLMPNQKLQHQWEQLGAVITLIPFSSIRIIRLLMIPFEGPFTVQRERRVHSTPAPAATDGSHQRVKAPICGAM
jgi:hypothetical protein